MNKITVTIPFSFKGKDYKPSINLDLDHFSQTNGDFSRLFHQVATQNGIDNYSYEYEVLESSPIFFSQPTGLAKAFLIDEHNFDLSGFKEKTQENEIMEVIQTIAKKQLGIEDLENNKKLKQALIDAYHAGESS